METKFGGVIKISEHKKERNWQSALNTFVNISLPQTTTMSRIHHKINLEVNKSKCGFR